MEWLRRLNYAVARRSRLLLGVMLAALILRIGTLRAMPDLSEARDDDDARRGEAPYIQDAHIDTELVMRAFRPRNRMTCAQCTREHVAEVERDVLTGLNAVSGSPHGFCKQCVGPNATARGAAAARPPPSRCVLVVGPESSGSKLAAQIVAHALVWPGRPWGAAGWRGHGDAINVSSGAAVLHRSQPNGGATVHFVDVRGVVALLARDARCAGVRVVVTARDQQLTLRSKLWRHQRVGAVAAHEQRVAAALLRDALAAPSVPTFVWSYEVL